MLAGQSIIGIRSARRSADFRLRYQEVLAEKRSNGDYDYSQIGTVISCASGILFYILHTNTLVKFLKILYTNQNTLFYIYC